MKKFLSILITAVIITGIYFLITYLFGKDCDRCGDKIYGTKYRIEGTSDVICERCAHWLK